MNWSVKVPYKIYEDGLVHQSYFSLSPDQPISFQFGGSFNWVGSVTVNGENHKICIPQKSIQQDPSPKDIQLPVGLRGVDVNLICKDIEQLLNRNMN